MKFNRLPSRCLSFILSLIGTIPSNVVLFYLSTSAQAQSITPAADSTGTVVNPQGNRLDISGGSLSGDQTNLFHSFEKFNLSPEQTANFLANPQLRNILGRITGGDASLINGLIQITGGNPNLFLMNPAGIVFGPNARLDIPGNFNATTANGILFGNYWFNAAGFNDYSKLVGNPSAFAFTMAQPGAIINAGNLSVLPGNSLNLIGGTVVNTGQLSAPSGQLTLTAVPGQNLVKMSLPGHLLSLEVQPIAPNSNQPNDWTLPVNSLPDLLTTGSGGYNLGATVNPDGSVKLTVADVNVPTNPGTAIASGSLDVSGNQGGKVGVFGQKVGVIGAEVNANGTNGGGTVLIGGDYQGKGTVPNANVTFVGPNSSIKADASLNGNGGKVIVWADQTTRFHGAISAQGGVQGGNGGFAEVSGKENLIYRGNTNLKATQGQTGTLLLDPKNIEIKSGNSDTISDNDQFGENANNDVTFSPNKIEEELGSADLILQANNNITVNSAINASSGKNLSLEAKNSIFINENIKLNGSFTATANSGVASGSGIIQLGGNVTTTNGSQIYNGPVTIANNSILTANGITFNNTVNGNSNLTINASSGNVTFNDAVGIINSIPMLGDVTVNSTGKITFKSSFYATKLSINEGLENAGTTELNGNIITTSSTGRSQYYQGNVKIIGDVTLTANEFDFVGGNVSGSGNFTLQPYALARQISLGGSEGNDSILSIGIAEINQLQNGFKSITIGRADGTGSISVADNVTFKDPVTVRTGTANITTTGTLTGTDNASITLQANSDIAVGNITTAGQDVNITNASATGNVTLNGDITTSSNSANGGNVTVIGKAIVAKPATPVLNPTPTTSIKTSAPATFSSGNITFSNTVNGASSGINTLELDAGNGKVTFSGAIGDTTPLNNLIVKATGGIELNGNVTTGGTVDPLVPSAAIGNQDYQGAVTLQNANVVLTGNEIDFTNAVSGTGNLILKPYKDTQAIAIGGSDSNSDSTLDLTSTEISKLQPGFSSITIGSNTLTGTIKAKDNLVFNSNVTLIGNVVLTQPTTITTTDDNITFDKTLDGNYALTLNTGTGNITFTGAVGDTTALGNLVLNSTGTTTLNKVTAASVTTNTGGTTKLNGSVTTTAGIQNYNDNVTIANSPTLKGSDISFNKTVDGNGSLQIDATNIKFGGNVGSTTALNSLTVNGSTTLQGNVTTSGTTGQIYNGTLSLLGDVSLTGNKIDFTNAVSGTGNLTLRPHDASQNITISGSGSADNNILDLTTDEINQLQAGFSSVTIGRSDGTGTITLNTNTVNSPVNIAGGSTLIGPAQDTIWNITTNNSGSLSTSAIALPFISFNSIENFEGRNGNDAFKIGNGVNLSGKIAGGTGFDTLDYSASTTSLTVNLAAIGADNIEQIIGSTNPTNTLIGTGNANNWTINGTNSGTVNNISFSQFQNLQGGAVNDTFNFLAGASIDGTITGGSGTNSLNYTNYNAQVDINVADQTAPGTSSFSNIQTFIGAAGNNNTLRATNTNNTWQIASNNTNTANNGSVNTTNGSVNTTFQFSEFNNFVGGTDDDTFKIGNGIASNSKIDGNLGTDTLDYSAATTSLTVNLASIGGNSIESIIGTNNASSTLIANNTDNNWNINGINKGTVNSINFSQFQNLQGGALNDTFAFLPGSSIDGTIAGSTGTNILNYANYNAAITLNLYTQAVSDTTTSTNINKFSDIQVINGATGKNNTLSLNGANTNNTWQITSANNTNSAYSGSVNSFQFSEFSNFIGGSGNDAFKISDGINPKGTIDGGLGSNDTLDYSAYTTALIVDLASVGANNIEHIVGTSAATSTLIGANTNNTWTIDGINSGKVNNSNFSQFQNLQGGTVDDSFNFELDGRINGTIAGASGNNSLNYTNYNSPVTINLDKKSASGINQDSQGVPGENGFSNIQSATGNTNSSTTLIAAGTPNTWKITGANSGTINETDNVNKFSFTNFANITGGQDTDSFVFAEAGRINGTIDGSAGTNTLDYSNFTQTVNLNLTSNTVTAGNVVSINNFTNIQSVIAGSATNDTLTGGDIPITWNISDQGTTISVGTGSLSFLNFENITSGNGNDTYNVRNYSSNIPLELDGKSGNDTYNIFFKGTGTSTIIIKDTGTTEVANNLNIYGTDSSDTLALSTGQVTRANETVKYDNAIKNLTLDAAVESDQINVSSSFVFPGNLVLTSEDITLDGDINTSALAGNINFNGNVNLAQSSTITTTSNAGSGKVTFNGTVNGTQNLTVNTGLGDITFNGAVGSQTPLGNLNLNSQGITSLQTVNAANITTDAEGTTLLQGSITTTNAQTYGDAVAISNNPTLQGNTITFNNRIDGNTNLTINTASGNLTFNGAVGSNTALSSLTTSSNAGITFINGSSINITGNQIYNNIVSLNASDNKTTLTASNITFNSIVRSSNDGEESLVVNSSGTTSFNAAVGDANHRLANLTSTNSGVTAINGQSITTTNGQTYNNTVTLGANTTLTTDADSNGAGNFVFNGNSLNTNGNSLTINAADVELTGTIEARAANVAFQPSTTTSSIGIGNGAIGSFNLSTAELTTNLNSSGDVTIGRADSTGIINIGAANNPVDLRAESYNFVVAGSGEFNLNNNFFTTGNQTYNNPVVLQANVTLQGNNISFNNIVNAAKDGQQSLTVNSNGSTIFGSDTSHAVGGVNRLDSLTTNGSGTQINTGLVRTTGTQTYNSAVTLGANTTLESSNNGNISFNNTINSDSTARSLNITTGGMTSFNNLVGNSSQLSSLTTDANGSTFINTNQIKTVGTQTYGDKLILGNDVVLESTNQGDINLYNTVNSNITASNLTVNTSGVTRFANTVGDTNSLNSLTTDAGGSTEISNNVTTSGAAGQNYNDIVSFKNNATLTGDELNFGNTISGVGTNLTLQPFTASQAIALGGIDSGSTSILDLTKAEIDFLQDGFSLIAIGHENGSGLITANGDVTFKDPVLLRSPVDSGAINLANGTLTGIDNSSISLEANQNITTANITTQGQPITINSSKGAITTALLNSSAVTGNGGDITLNADNNITTGDINASAPTGKAGNITLTTTDRKIAVEDITSADLTNGIINTGKINSSGAIGGNATLKPFSGLTAGQINTSATSGDAGNVVLGRNNQSIQFDFINAESRVGKGGDVSISSVVYVIAKDTFVAADGLKASISTIGVTSGAISITHGASVLEIGSIPIDIKRGGIKGSGTAGAITNGLTTLNNTKITGDYDAPNLTIRSVEPPPNFPKTTFITGGMPLLQQAISSEVTKGVDAKASSDYAKIGLNFRVMSDAEIQTRLQKIAQIRGLNPGLIYASFVPKDDKPTLLSDLPTDKLRLILMTSSGKEVEITTQVTREEIYNLRNSFFRHITDRERAIRQDKSYLQYGQQLYKWIIAPIRQKLQTQKINNLTFVMDAGLRSLPIAALHDGQEFVLNNYSVGFMPSFSSTETDESKFAGMKGAQVLAMGASEFTDQDPLPAVPLELAEITKIWKGQSLLGKDFNLEEFKKARASSPDFRIIHLATHGEFKKGELKNSYIQFGNQKVTLDQVEAKLNLQNPSVDLMVLSACRTALGDKDAELGFAGLAVKAGVKSALASLWYVNDAGTLALMTGFYKHLHNTPIKAKALQLAQLDLLQGKVKIEDGYLVYDQERIPLPEELASLGNIDFSHPYYWSAFSLVGNPW